VPAKKSSILAGTFGIKTKQVKQNIFSNLLNVNVFYFNFW